MKEPCYMCDNAWVDDELNFNNDLSYYSVGDCCDNKRMMFRSGAKKPTSLLIEEYDEQVKQWITVGVYQPKFCPNCGRELFENGER